MKDLLEFLTSLDAVRSGDESGAMVSVVHDAEHRLSSVSGARAFEDMFADATRMASQSFGAPKTDESMHKHLIQVETLAVLHRANEFLGFASLSPHGAAHYLHGIVVSDSYKGNGGSSKLIRALIQETSLSYLALTTQSPVVFCLLRSLTKAVYPSPHSADIPSHIREMGLSVAEARNGKFDPKSFTFTDIYDSCLYPTVPRSRHGDVNAWFERALNIRDGTSRNGFLLVGDIG